MYVRCGIHSNSCYRLSPYARQHKAVWLCEATPNSLAVRGSGRGIFNMAEQRTEMRRKELLQIEVCELTDTNINDANFSSLLL